MGVALAFVSLWQQPPIGLRANPSIDLSGHNHHIEALAPFVGSASTLFVAATRLFLTAR